MNDMVMKPAGGPRELYSLEAEQSVLGALLLDNATYERIVGTITPEHFYISDHVRIFNTIASLLNEQRQADVITVLERLKSRGELWIEQGGSPLDYLQQLVNTTYSTSSTVLYAEIIRELWLMRRVRQTLRGMGDMVETANGLSAVQLIDTLQANILALNESNANATAEYISMGEAVTEAMTAIDDAATALKAGRSLAIATGFKDLDRELGGGFYPGELIILGAGPSQGKSAFAMNVAEHVAKHGRAVGVNVMEMPAAQLAMRALASVSGVNAQRLREGRLYEADWSKISAGMPALAAMPIYIDATPGLDIEDIRARVRRLTRKASIGLLIVDYLQLMKVDDRANRVTEIGKISRGLKRLAMELKIPVMALSSLNRERLKRVDKRPTMGDLRESGDIESDADVILFLHREEMYHPGAVHPERGKAEIIIAKQRSGTLNMVPLGFKGDLTRFVDAGAD